jgi:beta-lactamase regulating signal transducer with metallopeptidase domain
MTKASSGARVWLIVVAVLIIAGVAAYFIGSAIGSNAQADNTAAEQAKVQDAQDRISSLQSLNNLLYANVWAYRAIYALDNRNFGVANDDVAKVAASLKAVEASSAGINGNAVSASEREAAGIKISVAQNLESQRAQLLHLAAGITRLVDQSEAKLRSTP